LFRLARYGYPHDVREVDERQTNRLRALAESTHVFAEATTDLSQLLNIVARRFADLIGDGCYVRLIASDGATLVPVATYHPDPEVECFLRETTDPIPLRIGEGISGRVVETGEAVFMPVVPFELYKKLTKPEFIPIFAKLGVSSLIVVRLRARATNLGFIALVRNGADRPAYTDEDLHLVQDLAERAALAIDNGRLVDGLERQVAERTHALETANRELEAFAYSVSHDLRSPLRAIDGFSRILEEDHATTLDDDARRTIGAIRRNTRRMTQLVDDLLRLSRMGHQALEPLVDVPMRELAEAVAETLRAEHASRTIELRIQDLPAARGNIELLRQVWINLLGNAVKYSRDRPVAIIEVGAERDGAENRYLIKDNGVGFDPAYADHLFGVFQRMHPASEFEGTGVGLALVQRIVSRHGGRVWGEGRKGEGATFGFALPHHRP
jgi:signal transduction histidine kinase